MVSHTPSIAKPVKQRHTLHAQLPERSTRSKHLAHAHGCPPLVPCALDEKRFTPSEYGRERERVRGNESERDASRMRQRGGQ